MKKSMKKILLTLSAVAGAIALSSCMHTKSSCCGEGGSCCKGGEAHSHGG